MDFLWQIRTARAFRALYQVLVVFLATTLKFKFKQSQCLIKKFHTGLTLEDSLYPPSHLSTSSLDTVSPGRARSPLDMEPVQVGRIPVQVGKMDLLTLQSYLHFYRYTYVKLIYKVGPCKF